MSRGVPVSVIVAALTLTAQHVTAGNFSDGSPLYRVAVRAVVSGLEQIAAHANSSIGRFMVDGGGDGDGGDGGGSGGDSSGTGDGSGTGDSTSTSNGDSNDGDAPSAPDATSAQTDPAATNPTVAPDQTTVTVTAEEQSIESIPTTDPRGGFDPENSNAAFPSVRDGTAPETNVISANLDGNQAGEEPVGASGVNTPRDVAINAVIVSGAQSPWDAIGKAPGVGKVIVTGGIVALGKTPIPGEPAGGGPQPPWLRLVPDLKLLNGSVIPPVVPNVIDIRVTSYSIEVVDKANK
jgi:hypothetical protein